LEIPKIGGEEKEEGAGEVKEGFYLPFIDFPGRAGWSSHFVGILLPEGRYEEGKSQSEFC
jgi:hypothetical protein